MDRAKAVLRRLLHPPAWVLLLLPPLSFGALIWVFLRPNRLMEYPVYVLSAYSLTILAFAVPETVRNWRRWVSESPWVRKIKDSRFGRNYRQDPNFREQVTLFRRMAVNIGYGLFRGAVGSRYGSVWFLSLAAYYLALGGLRAYLLLVSRHQDPERERRCCRRTARLLLLLDVPMGGMILQMVWANAGFSYPGYIIYVSAIYAFYAMGAAVANAVKARKKDRPVFSAAKVLDLISAMMSILGLQTAMIARFSENGDAFRRRMNAITGGSVYGAVLVLAAVMLLRSKQNAKEAVCHGPGRE